MFFFFFFTVCVSRLVYTNTSPKVFAVVISVVPSNRERLQTDEAVRVLRQLDGVPFQSHLVHVGPDVVTAVTFAECLICDCCYLVILQGTK